MNDFWFHVWWRQSDGRTYTSVRSFGTLPAAQRSMQAMHDAQAGSPDDIVAAGTSPIHCPPDGPWPRPGEVGREGHTPKAPGDDLEAAA